MVVEGALHGSGGELLELGKLFFCQRGAHGLDDVEACQRADAIAARGVAKRLVVGELGVAVGLDCFADDFAEAAGGDAVVEDCALGIDHAQRAVGELDRLVFVDQAHVVGREIRKDLDLRLEAVGDLLVGSEREPDIREGFRYRGQDLIAFGGVQRFGDAAGDNPTGVDALVAEEFDDVLAKAAQANAGEAQLRLRGDDAEYMACRGVGLHAQQQVRRGKIEEAQGVRLDHLRQVQHAAQLRSGVRDAHRHDGLAGLGRGDEMRDRADAADARHEAGHLVKRPALREPLEAAYLGDVEVRVLNLALVVELNGDLAVAFEAGNGIDGDCLGHDFGSN